MKRSESTLTLAAFWLATIGGCGPLKSCQPPPGDPRTESVHIAGERFDLEPATDALSRRRGLMGRTQIPAQGGMLFVFTQPRTQSFWMGYCLVDMDLIFLDPQGRVTAAHRMKVEPPRRSDESEPAYKARLPGYSSVLPAQFAIELRAGTIDRLGLEVESKVELDLPRLKALAR